MILIRGELENCIRAVLIITLRIMKQRDPRFESQSELPTLSQLMASQSEVQPLTSVVFVADQTVLACVLETARQSQQLAGIETVVSNVLPKSSECALKLSGSWNVLVSAIRWIADVLSRARQLIDPSRQLPFCPHSGAPGYDVLFQPDKWPIQSAASSPNVSPLSVV